MCVSAGFVGVCLFVGLFLCVLVGLFVCWLVGLVAVSAVVCFLMFVCAFGCCLVRAGFCVGDAYDYLIAWLLGCSFALLVFVCLFASVACLFGWLSALVCLCGCLFVCLSVSLLIFCFCVYFCVCRSRLPFSVFI